MTLSKVNHPASIVSPQFLKKMKDKHSSIETLQLYKLAKTDLLRQAKIDYTPRPLKVVDIGYHGVGIGHEEFTKDAAQSYAQALAYVITGNTKYLDNCLHILNSWASVCETFKGDNAPLEAAWGVASMTRSFEIVKYNVGQEYKERASGVQHRYVNWVTRLLMPHLRGETNQHKLKWPYNNWHTSIVEARLQFALLRDDLKEVNWCIDEYKRIFDTYIKDNGFTSETLRDSDHCCFGIAGLIQVAETLYHQGIDVYSLKNNLLHKVLEFHAGLYGGGKCPTGFDINQFKIQKWIQPCGWEIARHHFVVRKKMSTPNTDTLLMKIRPCKYELHWGYDTLTHGCSAP